MMIPAVCFLSEESVWQTDIEKKTVTFRKTDADASVT